MMLAWSRRSVITYSPRSTMAEIAPRFAWKPVEKTMAAGSPTSSASSSSSIRWMSRLPLRKREPEHPVP